jgi:DNA-directed RNA polymerase subunit RPC12/RpoP
MNELKPLVELKLTEYFCQQCGQLRLDLRNKGEDFCGHCGSLKIIRGEMGTLDKEAIQKGVSDAS